jgi:hypothetical protein
VPDQDTVLKLLGYVGVVLATRHASPFQTGMCGQARRMPCCFYPFAVMLVHRNSHAHVSQPHACFSIIVCGRVLVVEIGSCAE